MTALLTPQATPYQPHQQSLPPLDNGDRLSREEFLRRYRAMPDLKKAELIEGVVYMPSPVSLDHGDNHADLIGFLAMYRAHTPGVKCGDNNTLLLDPKNSPQPDCCLRIEPACGGRTTVSTERYIVGAPELIGEVAVSSASYDLHDKLEAYRRNGVCEYLVWRVWDQALDWFMLRDDQYQRLAPTAEGHFASGVFPGLWLDAAALLRGDLARVLHVLQQGLAAAEHREFVERLRQAFAFPT